MRPPLRVLSNVPALAELADPCLLRHGLIPKTSRRWAGLRLWLESLRHDVLLLDATEDAPMWPLCLARLLAPFAWCKLVVNDIQLNQPAGIKQRCVAWLRKQLLRGVDHFTHYFKDLAGYSQYYGITPERSSYLPFKVNDWELLSRAKEDSADGSYILHCGRSLRDVGTFLAAMRRVDLPAILLTQDRQLMAEHGTDVTGQSLPRNVRLVVHDGRTASWLRYLRGAKLVVIANLPTSIRATGVSTYLQAMALHKCVIITEGATTRGIIDDQAIVVPPADPASLASAMQTAWDDDVLRQRVAQAGRKYAESVQGADRLATDLLAICQRLAAREPAASAADGWPMQPPQQMLSAAPDPTGTRA